MQQKLYLLDYGAGNVRSLLNAVEHLGHRIEYIRSADDFDKADKIIFPGVGAFGYAVEALEALGFKQPLQQYIQSGRPLMGICVGMQVLFDGSDESPGARGLGVFEGQAREFDSTGKPVPHMGWNAATRVAAEEGPAVRDKERYYFVHSYAVPYEEQEYALTATRYGDECVVSSVWKGRVLATQFHPEKSGAAGLSLLRSFIEQDLSRSRPRSGSRSDDSPAEAEIKDHLTVRVVACLDVRANDRGDLVVTKGDQYDVRESQGDVRNLGKPVELAARYFEEGADEIAFLNITSFRDLPFRDSPMLEVLRQASRSVFVPLTIGGGVRDLRDPDTGREWPAAEVAGEYFRSGADKVSIGSDAVYAAERHYRDGEKLDGTSAIEQIARKYGRQAVVISVDPRRIYVKDPSSTPHHVIRTKELGPGGEQFCWYQCTVKGGREGRDVDVRQLVRACERMGAGEVLLNCMDRDGTNRGYDLELIKDTRAQVSIPVIASSGAGRAEHFSQCVRETGAEAVLAAGIFHRREVPIQQVKDHLAEQGIPARK